MKILKPKKDVTYAPTHCVPYSSILEKNVVKLVEGMELIYNAL